MAINQQSPPSARRTERPWTPSLPLRLVAHLLSILPFLFPRTPSELLHPLFSSSPSNAPRVVWTVRGTVAAVFLAHRFASSGKQQRRQSWRLAWIVLGVWKVVSEAIVRLAGEKLLGLGLARGVLVGRLLLEAVPLLAFAGWVVSSFECKERSMFLERWWIPLLCVASLLPPVHDFFVSFKPLLPECYILQAHGLLLSAFALFSPFTAAPPPSRSRPPSPPRPRKIAPAPPRHPRPASLSTRFCAFLAFAALAQLTALTNTHCPTSLASAPLGPRELPTVRVLAAEKSLTGWITVGEQLVQMPGSELKMEFKYLRADHSLLGGLWTGPNRYELQKKVAAGEEVSEIEVVRTAETIYSTFILQELVRLVKPPADLPRRQPEQGLIIGLGAGLSARALAAHGVNLTVCEIDPVVYRFAREYFAVDEPSGGVVLRDAVAYVEELREEGKEKVFDYIIHDVFTGGAVPSPLFTLDFWTSLKPLLHPSGVLAVNLAGVLSSPSTRYLLTTLLSSFPHCRAFEDQPIAAPADDLTASEREQEGFKNLVVLCTPAWFAPVEMRDPEKGDFLDAPSPRVRERVLGHFRKQEVDFAGFRFEGGEDAEWAKRERERWTFRRGMEKEMERLQRPEVELHWAAMEGVLTPEAWARW
ncbi:hypothetical protein JCM10207_001898 [Rhodosporidiobolus poonsookiae]